MTTGAPGSLFDPTASNQLGGMTTGIGFGTNSVYGPPLPAGMTDGYQVRIQPIGSANTTTAQAAGYAGAPLALDIATTPVAAGGTMPDGGTNLSGQTVPVGGAVMATVLSEVETSTWVSAVIANSGTVKASTSSAIDIFVKAAKSHGYWSKINRINLFCGDQLAAVLVPLKVGGGSALDTNVGLVAGDYSETTGLKGNGSSKYLKTGLIPSASLVLFDTHLSVYMKTGVSGTSHLDISCRQNLPSAIDFYLSMAGFSDNLASGMYASSSPGNITTATGVAPFGHFVGSRVSNIDHRLYKRGVQLSTTETALETHTALPNCEVYVFGRNDSGSLAFPSAHTLGGYSIGSGLTTADVALFSADMEAFQVALGRQS